MNTNFTILAKAKHKKKTVNNFLFILMGMLLVFTLNASAQPQPGDGCNLSNINGYYGGFEALPYLSTSGGTNGANNFGPTAASTDYTYGSGQTQYQILSSTAGQNGYLALDPHTPSYFLTSHTSSSQPNLKLWYKTLTVSPGQIFKISAWIANLKEKPVGGFPIDIFVNTYTVDPPTTLTTLVATQFAVTNAWVQITGLYTVPIGITSIEVEIKDPTPAFNGSSHFLALDDICIALQPAAGGPLPVSLVDFTASKQNKVVDLNWQTSIEQNSSYFDVEFSRDGSKFESIGKVKASASSSTLKNYSLKHLSPVNGLNYYRLKLVDVDGSFTYSAVRTVKFSNSMSIAIMPNPTADRVYITSNEGGILQSVSLYSISGKLLQQVNNFVLGKSIDLSTYSPSVYILKLLDKNGSTEVIKVVRK